MEKYVYRRHLRILNIAFILSSLGISAKGWTAGAEHSSLSAGSSPVEGRQGKAQSGQQVGKEEEKGDQSPPRTVEGHNETGGVEPTEASLDSPVSEPQEGGELSPSKRRDEERDHNIPNRTTEDSHEIGKKEQAENGHGTGEEGQSNVQQDTARDEQGTGGVKGAAGEPASQNPEVLSEMPEEGSSIEGGKSRSKRIVGNQLARLSTSVARSTVGGGTRPLLGTGNLPSSSVVPSLLQGQSGNLSASGMSAAPPSRLYGVELLDRAGNTATDRVRAESDSTPSTSQHGSDTSSIREQSHQTETHRMNPETERAVEEQGVQDAPGLQNRRILPPIRRREGNVGKGQPAFVREEQHKRGGGLGVHAGMIRHAGSESDERQPGAPGSGTSSSTGGQGSTPLPVANRNSGRTQGSGGRTGAGAGGPDRDGKRPSTSTIEERDPKRLRVSESLPAESGGGTATRPKDDSVVLGRKQPDPRLAFAVENIQKISQRLHSAWEEEMAVTLFPLSIQPFLRRRLQQSPIQEVVKELSDLLTAAPSQAGSAGLRPFDQEALPHGIARILEEGRVDQVYDYFHQSGYMQRSTEVPSVSTPLPSLYTVVPTVSNEVRGQMDRIFTAAAEQARRHEELSRRSSAQGVRYSAALAQMKGSAQDLDGISAQTRAEISRILTESLRNFLAETTTRAPSLEELSHRSPVRVEESRQDGSDSPASLEQLAGQMERMVTERQQWWNDITTQEQSDFVLFTGMVRAGLLSAGTRPLMNKETEMYISDLQRLRQFLHHDFPHVLHLPDKKLLKYLQDVLYQGPAGGGPLTDRVSPVSAPLPVPAGGTWVEFQLAPPPSAVDSSGLATQIYEEMNLYLKNLSKLRHLEQPFIPLIEEMKGHIERRGESMDNRYGTSYREVDERSDGFSHTDTSNYRLSIIPFRSLQAQLARWAQAHGRGPLSEGNKYGSSISFRFPNMNFAEDLPGPFLTEFRQWIEQEGATLSPQEMVPLRSLQKFLSEWAHRRDTLEMDPFPRDESSEEYISPLDDLLQGMKKWVADHKEHHSVVSLPFQKLYGAIEEWMRVHENHQREALALFQLEQKTDAWLQEHRMQEIEGEFATQRASWIHRGNLSDGVRLPPHWEKALDPAQQADYKQRVNKLEQAIAESRRLNSMRPLLLSARGVFLSEKATPRSRNKNGLSVREATEYFEGNLEKIADVEGELMQWVKPVLTGERSRPTAAENLSLQAIEQRMNDLKEELTNRYKEAADRRWITPQSNIGKRRQEAAERQLQQIAHLPGYLFHWKEYGSETEAAVRSVLSTNHPRAGQGEGGNRIYWALLTADKSLRRTNPDIQYDRLSFADLPILKDEIELGSMETRSYQERRAERLAEVKPYRELREEASYADRNRMMNLAMVALLENIDPQQWPRLKEIRGLFEKEGLRGYLAAYRRLQDSVGNEMVQMKEHVRNKMAQMKEDIRTELERNNLAKDENERYANERRSLLASHLQRMLGHDLPTLRHSRQPLHPISRLPLENIPRKPLQLKEKMAQEVRSTLSEQVDALEETGSRFSEAAPLVTSKLREKTVEMLREMPLAPSRNGGPTHEGGAGELQGPAPVAQLARRELAKAVLRAHSTIDQSIQSMRTTPRKEQEGIYTVAGAVQRVNLLSLADEHRMFTNLMALYQLFDSSDFDGWGYVGYRVEQQYSALPLRGMIDQITPDHFQAKKQFSNQELRQLGEIVDKLRGINERFALEILDKTISAPPVKRFNPAWEDAEEIGSPSSPSSSEILSD